MGALRLLTSARVNFKNFSRGNAMVIADPIWKLAMKELDKGIDRLERDALQQPLSQVEFRPPEIHPSTMKDSDFRFGDDRAVMEEGLEIPGNPTSLTPEEIREVTLKYLDEVIRSLHHITERTKKLYSKYEELFKERNNET